MEAKGFKRHSAVKLFRQLRVVLFAATLCFASTNGWAGTPGQYASTIQKIRHIVVIYQENWSFDSLYGKFPGANGIADASQISLTQLDGVTGRALSTMLGQPFNRITSAAPQLSTPPEPINNNVSPNVIDSRFLSSGILVPNTLLPYDAQPFVATGDKTGDIVHRYWHEFAQIDGGRMDKFIAWSDNPGLVMSYFNASDLPEGKLAQQFTMGDNFFHSAFGGSFLNHQFLISAAPPVFPFANSISPNSIATVDVTGHLALDANGKIVHDGNITPVSGVTPSGSIFDKYYAVNTIYSKNMVPTFKNVTDVEHPGYADLLTGQQHVADLVSAIQQSKYWNNTLIIITYDEHGGRWDHVAPPKIRSVGAGLPRSGHLHRPHGEDGIRRPHAI